MGMVEDEGGMMSNRPASIEIRPDRDLRIDFFRGLALIGITINHTVPPKTLMATVGHYQFGHVFGFAWAEVFVLLSGIVCGMAYLRPFQTGGVVAASEKVLKRIFTIWLTAMGALLLMWCVLGAMQVMLPKYNVEFLTFDYRSLWPDTWAKRRSVVINTLLLSPPYLHFNILRFYVVLLLMLPAGLALYVRFRYMALATSALVWAWINVTTGPFGPQLRLHGLGNFFPALDPSFGDGPFGNYLAWQFLFFLGMAIGVERKRGTLRVPMNATVAVLLGAALALADALRQLKFAYFHFDSKVYLGPLRLVELLSAVTLIAWMVPANAAFFTKGLAGVIRRLGTRSLTIFAFTLFSCYLFTHIAAIVKATAPVYLAILIAHVTAVLLVSAGLDAVQKKRTT
ncbi:MAG: OpgC domain-containing protein [Tepidisphaeraceae bacterium]